VDVEIVGGGFAGHLLDDEPSPERALAGAYPSYGAKRLLRAGLDLRPPNALLDLALDGRVFRSLARTIFFHHRGLLSPAAWRDLAAATPSTRRGA
jgi:hypothetical protein